MPLSETKLRTLKTPGKHFDGGGLYLEVTRADGYYWRLKYRFAGKEKRLAFGVYPTVSLKQARTHRDNAKRELAKGVDPGEVKRAAKVKAKSDSANSFQSVADAWMAHAGAKWTPTHAARIRAAFEANVFPALGSRPISEITASDVKAIVKKLEGRGVGETASRVLMRVRAVFRYAVVHELISSNPLSELVPGDILRPRNVLPRVALPEGELPQFLAKLVVFDGDPATHSALRILVLTAVRPGEVRGARWEEIDESKAVWRIPAERMKMRTPHVVPLSQQALSVLREMKKLSGEDELIFPSPYYPGKGLSENTFNSALARMGYKGIATAHGFRALFSTVANEAGWNADAIERQLAHMERNKIRAAYHRSEYLDERRKLMQWWANFLDSKV
jgi:integrase